MRLQENSIDFTTLTWVKPELDETLKQARNALQSYVEEGESPGELRTCSDLLHQVQGTLRMVELYGAAMVAEEMEQLSRALIDKKVEDRDNAYAVLMQGIVQLPDYLERLQGGHRDIPIVLLPLLNQLRASRGEKDLNESVLFSPDLSRPLPASAQGPRVPLDQAELSRRAEALRGLFQGALLRWLKDDNSAATIRDLTDVCEQLVPITAAEPARRLFWVAAGTLDALGRNAFPISNPLKQALAKIEREIKRLAEGGDAAFRSDPPIELTKQLLYFVAHEGSDTGRVGEIRQVFGLSGNEPSEAELAHARGSLSGNNRALLETVAVAIKDDLLRVKDALDLHLRTPGARPDDLAVQVDALDRVADTLGMLGLGVPRRVVQDQRSAINDVVAGQRRDDEATLLDIAGALLYVEAALDDQVERLGKEGNESPTAPAAASNESRRLLEVLVKEAIVNFSQARQSFVAFVETHWNHQQLAEVPRLLNEVSGALRILNIPLPADYLVGIRQFTENELLQRKQVPNGQQMDRLADALASLEYFLEALRDRRPNRDQILEVARQSLTALGYWPLTAAMRAAPTRVATPLVPAAKPEALGPVEADSVETGEAAVGHEVSAHDAASTASPAPAPAPAAAATVAAQSFTGMVGELVPGFDGASSEEIDDEIREVFLEEFEEEIDNLVQLLPPWQQDPANAELLRPIRRVFHTLKGSGRLVGAKTLGEFSWKVEGMLNRVLDGSRPASPEVFAIVQLALQHLPLLRAALQGQEVYADLEGIQVAADAVASGEEITYRPPSMPGESEPVAEPEIEAAGAEASIEAEAEVEAVEAGSGEGEGSGFSIDPVLLEILKPEVAGHLESVDAWLAACAARGPQPVTDPLLRSIHTMNGAFAMTEVTTITDVTAPLESFVKRSLAHNLNPGEAGVALVADAAKAIRSTIRAIEKPNPMLPHFDDLAARAVALRDTLPDSMLPSVPVHAEDDTGPMPQVVVMEAADTSGIPDFAPDAEVASEAELAPVAEPEAEAEVEAVFEAETAIEAEPVAEIEAVADAGTVLEAEAPAEAEAEAEAEAPIDLQALMEAEAVPEFEASAEAENIAVEASHTEPLELEAFEGESFEEAAVAAEPEPAFEMEFAAEPEVVADPVASEWITAEYALLDVESESAESAPTAEPVMAEVAAADQAEFVMPEELSDFDEEAARAEQAAVEELAAEEAAAEAAALAAAATTTADIQAPEEFEPAAEADLAPAEAVWDEDSLHEAEPAAVAHADFPEDQLLSLEDFLREAGERADQLMEAEQLTAAGEAQVPAEAAMAEEGVAHEPEAEAAMAAMAEPDTAEFEVAEFEVAGTEDAVVIASDEPLEGLSDSALASMIAAYGEDEAPAQAAAEAEPAFAVDEDFIAAADAPSEDFIEEGIEARFEAPSEAELQAAADNQAEADLQAEVEAQLRAFDSGNATALPVSEEEMWVEGAGHAEPAVEDAQAGEAAMADAPAAEAVDGDAGPAPVAIDDEFYGMSLAELEALTAPEGEAVAASKSPTEAEAIAEVEVANVEADGFADLPLIADIPAWTSPSTPEASELREYEAAEATPEAVLESEPELTIEEAEFLAEVEAPIEAEASVEAEAPVDLEAELEAVAEAEPEAVAELDVVAEPEVEPANDAEMLFDDEPEEAEAEHAQAAAEPVQDVERAVAAPRPVVPMAQDASDPEADLDMADLDPELLDLFLEESIDILDHSDGVLARLREFADDRESIVTLQRDLHTLKGGARMAGIYAVGELGHAMESLLESVAEGRQKLDQTGVVVLERGFDRLHGMVARIGERKAIRLPAGLIAQVEALSEGRSLGEFEISDAGDGEVSTAPSVRSAPPSRLSAPIEGLDDEEMTGVRAPQEQVRIRADLLDRLVNYAGEVAIYRARLEQQLGAFRSNLGELNQTTTRLREQLRRLDIETEAQIVARYQREGETQDESFDPLELDRFTNQQQLTRALNESANDLVNLQGVLDELTRQYETLLLQQSRVSSDLQEGLMRTRMVPFDALVPRLRRVLRQAATDTGKQVQLKVDGASGEMDRNVLERMTAPLEHMLRNAMAHGLEMPADRRKAKKAEEGTVRIAVQREGSEVVLKVSDDGLGLNKQAIRDKAIERGLMKADAELSDEALYSMILETGFSTAETVSRLSGRGVGMDVVYSEIRQLGGTLQIKSEYGVGSEFIIRLPFTLAVTQAVFVKIGDTSFAVPIASVQGVGRISRADLDKQLAGEHPVFGYAGEDYAIHDLGQLIGHAPAKAQDSLQMPLLLARSGDLRTAICIDQVLGSREIVVKPVGPQVNSVPGIFGATIMGDGRVVVILDVAPLVRRQSAIVRDVAPVVPAAPVAAARRVPVVMVVDDSITMRKVTGRVLERNNMEVLTAKDGVDAVEKMAERVPDLVLLDIEMPRMDGYEVAQNMKSDPRLKDVPIIMITSRTGDKHRQRAMDIGVDRYLGKPYQEPELMRNVFEMLGLEAVNG